MVNPEISIIIPFYNVEESLIERCLKSIIASEFDSYEILLIDDGSDTYYSEMIQQKCMYYDKLKIIKKMNGGVSDARNYGVKCARGKYIVFVDADDAVSRSFLKEAYNLIKSSSADIVIGGCVSVTDEFNFAKSCLEDENDNHRLYKKKEISYIRNRFINDIIRHGDVYLGAGCWARIINSDIAKKIEFPKDLRIGEDVVWNQKVFSECNTIMLSYRPWYFHYENALSATHSYNDNNINVIKKMYIELLESVDITFDNTFLSIVKRLYSDTHWHICMFYLTNTKCEINYRRRKQIFKDMLNMYPWTLFNSRAIKLSDCKWKLRFILLKTGFVFPIFNYIDKQRNKRGK